MIWKNQMMGYNYLGLELTTVFKQEKKIYLHVNSMSNFKCIFLKSTFFKAVQQEFSKITELINFKLSSYFLDIKKQSLIEGFFFIKTFFY